MQNVAVCLMDPCFGVFGCKRLHYIYRIKLKHRWYVNEQRYREDESGDTVQGQMSGLLAGSWRVEASNCLTNTVSTTFNVDIEYEELRPPRGESRASVVGLSHVTTFGGAQDSYTITGLYFILMMVFCSITVLFEPNIILKQTHNITLNVSL